MHERVIVGIKEFIRVRYPVKKTDLIKRQAIITQTGIYR